MKWDTHLFVAESASGPITRKERGGGRGKGDGYDLAIRATGGVYIQGISLSPREKERRSAAILKNKKEKSCR